MHDTDPFERPPFPVPPPIPAASRRPRGLLPSLDHGEHDRTPITAPSWEPPPPTRLPRIARGTQAPEVRNLPDLYVALATIAGVRVIPPRRRWGSVVRVPLDPPPAPIFISAAPALAALGFAAVFLAFVLSLGGGSVLGTAVHGTSVHGTSVHGTAVHSTPAV